MKIYYLKDSESSGNVYYKGYNHYTKQIEWTGVIERAAFWLVRECAIEQQINISINHGEYWEVREHEHY